MTLQTPDAGVKANPLALSMGEPAGIGGEVTLKAWLRRKDLLTSFFVIDDPCRLTDLSNELGIRVPIAVLDKPDQTAALFSNALPVLSVGRPVRTTNGVPTKDTAAAVLESIETAVRLTQAGDAGGIVTNPVQKEILYSAGF
ncbi:MAG: 4-hydroxythreonine-4-phosphate dehydrogenase, partial [Rhodospirillales bacterium]|nr:4-hydroxythreonine-4-phosphate dehydrogenase [Rhodospirillales bacterium]